MENRFYTSTVISKFIKYLLQRTPLPVYKLIYDNDDMIKGCVYTYKDKVLKCTKSGRFVGINGSADYQGYLYVMDDLKVHETYTPKGNIYDNGPDDEKRYVGEGIGEGGMQVWKESPTKNSNYKPQLVPFSVTDDYVSFRMYDIAEFEIVSTITPGTNTPGITQIYTSNSNYYDTMTHRYLGEYLRWLQNMYDLDLMGLYNCFNYEIAENITLRQDVPIGLIQVGSEKYKTYLVPIKFDRVYTIAIQSEFPVLLKSVFYNNGLVKDSKDQEYLNSYIDEPVICKNNSRFSEPFHYSLTYRNCRGNIEETYRNLYMYERYLYLAIQVPVNNNSSVVVIEGEYSGNESKIISDVYGLKKGVSTQQVISKMLTANLSLLSKNENQQKPFADKLIEYLLKNTIDTREYIDDNVSNVEKKIGYNPKYQGMWDDTLRYIIFNRYISLENRDDIDFEDILGYVDSDIEEAIRKGYINA